MWIDTYAITFGRISIDATISSGRLPGDVLSCRHLRTEASKREAERLLGVEVMLSRVRRDGEEEVAQAVRAGGVG